MGITVYEQRLWELFLNLGWDSVKPGGHNSSAVMALGNKFVHTSVLLQESKEQGWYVLCLFVLCHILKFDKPLLRHFCYKT